MFVVNAWHDVGFEWTILITYTLCIIFPQRRVLTKIAHRNTNHLEHLIYEYRVGRVNIEQEIQLNELITQRDFNMHIARRSNEFTKSSRTSIPSLSAIVDSAQFSSATYQFSSSSLP